MRSARGGTGRSTHGRSTGVRHARPRSARTLAGIVGVTVAVVMSGCAIGPDPGPDLISGDEGQGQATTSTPPPAPPALTAPRKDLAWSACAREVADGYQVPVPAGVTVECATFDSPIDPARPDDADVTIAATRLRSPQTPPNAAPLVLTSGSDLPSSRTLMLLASGPGRAILASHPIVAVDRRGILRSKDIDCMTRAEKSAMVHNGLAGGNTTTELRIASLAQSAASASDSCTETLTPYQLSFGIGSAASDLETLRQKWGVERLGLIGVGEGADVVLAYSSLHAPNVGRVILDTPTPFGAGARDRGQVRATGIQAGLQSFAQRCANIEGCSLGATGAATMTRVIDSAARGRLGPLSDTQVLAAITTAVALVTEDPAALPAIANAITAADAGNTAALERLAATAASLRLSDGSVVATCNDMAAPVGQNEIPQLVSAWSRQNPLTGTDTALSLLRCNGWAPAEIVAPPASLAIAPLVLNGSNDTINGGNGAGALGAIFQKISVTPVTVSWDGIGYSVLARSSCAADVVAEYVDRAPLSGPTERGCPA